MKYVDMHCDTITALMKKENETLLDNSLHIDLNKLKKGDYLLQNFAIFTPLSKDNPRQFALEAIGFYKQEIAKYPNIIKPVYCYEDIEDNIKNNLISSLLTLEEGDVIDGDLSNLDKFYEDGVRMITLTWNYRNAIGYPNITMKKEMNLQDGMFNLDTVNGLTDFGFEYLQKMKDLGIIVDVSHLSDKGFYDVYEHMDRPFVASHSNSRSICDVARNLSDDMIRKLADKGGVMGLNYCSSFINYNADKSYVNDMIKHIQHIINVGGSDVIGLGSDFDGIDNNLEINNAALMRKLYYGMKDAKFSDELIDKITHLNVLRVYKEILK